MRKLGLVPRNMFDEFDKSLNEFFAPAFRGSDPVQVVEKDKYFQINVDLPGVKKEDVNVDIKDDILFIKAHRKNEFDSEGVHERSYGKFERSFRVPKNINQDEMGASLEDGVLRMVLPKAKSAASSRKIEIQDSLGKLEQAS